MFRFFSIRVLLFVASILLGAPAHAGLRFQAGQTDWGLHYITVSGDFAYQDDLSLFENLVRSNAATAVTFSSPGGNIQKAVELGRLIRRLGINTIQFRAVECASACSLAFLGGVIRYADPGSIGVHKSSFQGDVALTTQEAVSAVQQITADVITYMIEMGVDPALLQLSLQYDSNDIRYLSMSEMVKYRVVTFTPEAGHGQVASEVPPSMPMPQQQPTAPSPAAAPPSSVVPPSPTAPSLVIPQARSGRIGHPKGSAPLKALPEGKSANIAVLRNGSWVAILGSSGRWYRVQTGNQVGYMHDTWVHVDQYDSGPFGKRHIQVKSFDNYAEAEAYVRSASIPLSAYLATNGWFAITLERTFDEPMAKGLVREMKARGAIPDDAYATFGNTYVRKVCCH
ncbi:MULTISPECIES: hypothetical protein [unclassified Mesorhizobium]|uniref:hypothetical protein n=1 Tax=unclassified Mesorhizobium TaxID=325217 RepID=UPI001091AD73|nr:MULTISPECIES: hypothetical protein [unclassified Mesorhizobium]TGQ27737.1 hypothetical protein EN857_32580 [Mesorhizobium sp. M4B.F.Ca.ET.214.01.1.1]TGQ54929.1 hypothetical protein EN854_32465 [Mesorhizobium sp. M4B.F.Ca.ET.211.01.1.1]TGU28328.1 hypothetical protein EN793_32425 [Mesorhizobium sp. M4B.F.Ca.ET.150.01.1.1]